MLASTAPPDLLGVLRARRAQAKPMSGPYAPRVAQDTMRWWLGRAANRARLEADRKQVHVAAEMSADQSTVYRFEQGVGWPRDTDIIVAAYAADLDIDPMELWSLALEMWRESGSQAGLADLQARRAAKKSAATGARAVRRAAKRVDQPNSQSAERRSAGRRAPRKAPGRASEGGA